MQLGLKTCKMPTSDQSPYTIEFRIMAAAKWHDSEQDMAAMRKVRKYLADTFQNQQEPPDGRIIKQWHEKLFTTGSILDVSRSGRRSMENNNALIDYSVQNDPNMSVRRRSIELDISKSNVHHCLKKQSYKPYKPTFVQFLTNNDKQIRVDCCRELSLTLSPEDKRKVLFSDECAVYGDCKMKNVVFWSKDNPHYHQQIIQHPPMVMIWGAMSFGHLIGPFFIEGRLTAAQYCNLMNEEVIPALKQLDIFHTCIFQQDGAPAHTAKESQELLNNNFPDRWIGKFGPLSWPPRSPDLTSCDNALWGIVKKRIHSANPHTREEVKEAARVAFQSITQDELANIHKRTWRRIDLCVDLEGVQVDPYE